MTNSTEYNLAAIRELLLAAFTAEALRRFCMDRQVFRPLLTEFGPGMGLDDMIDRVFDYCRTQLLWGELLTAVREANLRQYVHFEHRIHNRTTPSALHARHPTGSERVDSSPLNLSTIATAAVTTLSAYLTEADEAPNSKTVGTTWTRAAEIHRAIKARFIEEKDEYHLQTLKRFEEMPEKRSGAMREALEEALENDRDFAQSLNSLLKRADETGGETITQHVAVRDQAQTGNITQIGKVQGGVDLTSKR